MTEIASTVKVELEAAATIAKALEPLDRAARLRVLRWARDRFIPWTLFSVGPQLDLPEYGQPPEEQIHEDPLEKA